MLVGEGQIAGPGEACLRQPRISKPLASILNPLFQHAQRAAKRVRTETGIARGRVSVSSAAVDYVRQVLALRRQDHTGDRRRQDGRVDAQALRQLKRGASGDQSQPEKADGGGSGCGGIAVRWDQLDDVLARADIVLSTTGAPEPIMTRERYNKILPHRTGGPVVILDIAVPRDFDPRIHDGDRTCLFNIDDLKRIREQTLRDRLKHVAPAEAIIEQEHGGSVGIDAAAQWPDHAPADAGLRGQAAGNRERTSGAVERPFDRRGPGRHRGGIPALQNASARPDLGAGGGAARGQPAHASWKRCGNCSPGEVIRQE